MYLIQGRLKSETSKKVYKAIILILIFLFSLLFCHANYVGFFDGFDAVADLLQSIFLDNRNDKSHFMIVDKTTTQQKTQKEDYSFDGSISRLKRKKCLDFLLTLILNVN